MVYAFSPVLWHIFMKGTHNVINWFFTSAMFTLNVQPATHSGPIAYLTSSSFKFTTLLLCSSLPCVTFHKLLHYCKNWQESIIHKLKHFYLFSIIKLLVISGSLSLSLITPFTIIYYSKVKSHWLHLFFLLQTHSMCFLCFVHLSSFFVICLTYYFLCSFQSIFHS